MTAPLDLLVVGDIDVDIYVQVPRLPVAGEKVRGTALGSFPGGVAANVAVAAARLGLASGVHGVIGDDPNGQAALEALIRAGVDTSAVVVDPSVLTFFCLVQLDRSGDKALTLGDTGCLFPDQTQLDASALARARHVHLAPFELADATTAAEVAAAAGARVSADLEPGSMVGGLPALQPLLALLDLCFINHHAAELLAASTGTSDPLTLLHDHGIATVVLTAGGDGTVVSTADGIRQRIPALEIDVVDTTGAGDAFCAAYLATLHRGLDVVAAARAAVVAGALACRAVGAQSAAPSRAELDAALAARAPL